MRRPEHAAPRVGAVFVALAAALAIRAAAASEMQNVGPGHASSTCVGESGSARCAVDTLMACFARASRSLCARIGAEPPDGAPEPRRLEYVVERESVISADQITDDLREIAWFKPGFTLVELQIRSCKPDAADCDSETWEDLQVYLRQQGPAWRVVHWRAPGDPDAPVQVPDALR
ncbi:MAG: hypothetical protein JNK67_31670 [Alphaproteobacteria bacterium]|nr:hypothetical protein [Alphaproteobacteria bacterium]